MFRSICVSACLTGVFAAAVLSGGAWAEEPATTEPFGLAWGQTRDEIVALGVVLEDCRAAGTAETCEAAGLPKALEDAGIYRVVIDRATGLVSARFRSAPITGDPAGEAGKAMYERTRAVVSATHGEGRRQEFVFAQEGYGPDDFYACLFAGGRCGLWTSEWRGLGIALGLNGVSPSQGGGGYVELIYYRPV